MSATAPAPDPTLLTTEAVERAIGALRQVLEARLDGADRLIVEFQRNLDTRRAAVDEKIDHLKELHSEKFSSIQKQFDASKEAVTAAFNAAKEAVAEQNKSNTAAISKSETAMTKQIEQQGETLRAETKALHDQVADIKLRLAEKSGAGTGMAATWGYIVMAIAIATGIVTLATIFHK